MKIAVLSDIHGNLPALEAVAADIERWRPDFVVVNGDTVNRGPKSVACWQFVQKRPFWNTLRGNHEAYVIEHSQHQGEIDEIGRLSHWVYQQFGGEIAPLSALPTVQHFNNGRFACSNSLSDVVVTHASLRGNRDGIDPKQPPAHIQQQISLCPALAATAPAVFATGHTHKPSIFSLNHTLIVNAGSVGQPCDGDLRACYARIWQERSGWQAVIRRVAYDRQQTERDFRQSRFFEAGGWSATLIYEEWRTGRDVLASWLRRYGSAVAAGDMVGETAVWQHLHNLGLS